MNPYIRLQRLLFTALSLSLLLSACASGPRATQPADLQATAMAMFRERCKTAGEKIYKTVENVEGIYLLKLRPSNINYGDQFKLDDPYGRDLGGVGYIQTFVRGGFRGKDMPEDGPPRLGYLYVEAEDPKEGKRYRYTGHIEEPWKTNKAYLQGYTRFVLDKRPAPGPAPRYGVTYDDISTREEREYWIAASSLKVNDLQTNEVIAERVGYMVDWAQGSRAGVSESAASRVVYHAALADLQARPSFKSLEGKVALHAIGQNLATQAKARVDFQTVVALQTLSPFVLNPAGSEGKAALEALWQSDVRSGQYEAWHADLALLNAGKQPENFTDEYLTDRSLLLQTVLIRNRENIQGQIVGNGNMPGDRVIDFRYYEGGNTTPVTLTAWNPAGNGGGNALSTRPRQLIVFDSDKDSAFAGTDETRFGDRLYGGGGNDTISGLGGDDHLEGNSGNDSLDGGAGHDELLGGAGDDTLIGGEGHDMLLGGAGEDTYYFEGDTGLDIISDSDSDSDSDGKGRIVVGAPGFEPLSGGKKLADNAWISDDKRFTYTLVDGNLVIRPAADSGASGILTVKDWSNGQLGITLSETPALLPPTSTSYIGDFAKKTNPEASTQYVLGEDGQYLGQYVPDGSEPGALDLITGSGGADLIQGLGGDDALLGAGGDDIVEGGEGNDVLMGGLGADRLQGGGGRDLIYGSSTGSLQYPLTNYPVLEVSFPIVLGEGFNWKHTSPGLDDDGFQQSFLSNNVGRDTQANDAANTIDGGSGDDIIYAGTGNDVVHGGQDQDQITGMAGADVLLGDEGNDRIYGDGSATNIGALTHTPASLHGNDILVGGTGNDLLIGQGGDAMYGGIGDDRLYGDDINRLRWQTTSAIHACLQRAASGSLRGAV